MTVNTLGTHAPIRTPTVAERLWQFLPAGISVLSMSALGYYHFQLLDGPVQPQSALQFLYAQIYRGIGLAPAMMFFLLVTVWSVLWYVTGTLDRPLARLGRLVAMTVMLGMFLNIGDGGVAPAANKGELGAWLAGVMVGAFGYWPSLLLVWAITFLSLLLATDFFFIDRFERVGREPEQGVEVGVTDHLRRLGEVTEVAATLHGTAASGAIPSGPIPSGPVASEGSSAAFAAAVAAAAAAAEDAERDESPMPTAAPEVVATDEPKLSYFERRRAREARRWGGPVDDGWVPAPPENQEIDNPEASASVAEPTEAGVPPGEAVDRSEAAAPAESVPPSIHGAVETARAESTRGDLVAGEPSAAAWPWSQSPTELAPEPAAQGERWESAAVDEPEPSEGLVDATDAEWTGADSDEREPVVDIPRPEVTRLREVEVGDAGADSPTSAGAAPDALPPVELPRVELPRVELPLVELPSVEPLDRGRGRQQGLFGARVEEGLVQEAVDLVTGSRRASAAFLQRKLRIDYPLAIELLAELAARGVIALEGDATQGRVVS